MDPMVLLVLLVAVVLAGVVGWWIGRGEAASLRTALGYERAATREKVAVLDEGRARFEQAFAALSADALERNNRQFLDLAAATLQQAGVAANAELDSRRVAVEHLVAPLRDTLGRVEGQLRDLEAARGAAYTSVVEQVTAVRKSSEQLRSETASLVAALRRPQARGAWGEMSLRRAAEVAGMTEHCDFVVQPTFAGPDGAQRPDMVVRLAGGKSVVVDSKVPLDAFLDAMDASDEAAREQLWAAHARRLRAHVDALAAKAYWESCPGSPEFVVLFVPREAFLAPALDADPGLLDYAATRKVVLATPTTLIALLRTVAYAWTQAALADNAREVYETGRELYARLGTLGEHVDKLGRSLSSAVGSYNKAVGSLESRVLVTARRFAAMGLVQDELVTPVGVEAGARGLTAPELLEPELPGPELPGPELPGPGLLGSEEPAGELFPIRPRREG